MAGVLLHMFALIYNYEINGTKKSAHLFLSINWISNAYLDVLLNYIQFRFLLRIPMVTFLYPRQPMKLLRI
jgi:hypothetical protein